MVLMWKQHARGYLATNTCGTYMAYDSFDCEMHLCPQYLNTTSAIVFPIASELIFGRSRLSRNPESARCNARSAIIALPSVPCHCLRVH
jgi:hypothetical protein